MGLKVVKIHTLFLNGHFPHMMGFRTPRYQRHLAHADTLHERTTTHQDEVTVAFVDTPFPISQASIQAHVSLIPVLQDTLPIPYSAFGRQCVQAPESFPPSRKSVNQDEEGSAPGFSEYYYHFYFQFPSQSVSKQLRLQNSKSSQHKPHNIHSCICLPFPLG